MVYPRQLNTHSAATKYNLTGQATGYLVLSSPPRKLDRQRLLFMSSLHRYAIILGLALGCTGFSTTASSQATTQKKATTASVSGRVTIHGKGTPGIIVGVRNSNFSPQPAPTLKATTDLDGNYRITGIPAGSYQVLPMAPAYVISDQVFPRARAKMLLLAEGEEVQDIDFSIAPGGVIAGRVTDADGRPVIEERLMIVSADAQPNSRGQMPPTPGVFQTDDRGVYRIYGIPPGRYKISVGVADNGPSSNVRVGRVAYMRTFYPDATELDDAKVIEISEGIEATNIDITVGRSLPGFAASGKVVDGETGQPMPGLRLGLRSMVNDRGANMMGLFTMSNGRGEFRLENVPPGKYAVSIIRQPGSEARAEALPFEVIDQDVTGLVLTTIKGLTITGNVVLENGYDKVGFAKLTQLRLQAYVSNEGGDFGTWQETLISADGSFRLGGLGPGKVNFSLSGQDRRPAVGFVILRIERDGVTHARFVEIKDGEQTSGVKIIVRYGTGSVRGQVTVENGPLPPNARVVVWIKKVGDTGQNYRPYNLDARGHFLIEGVAAGSYELNVNLNIPGRRAAQPVKQSIDVSEGNVTDVVVSLDLKSNQDQPLKP
jgi:hypothetical protein